MARMQAWADIDSPELCSERVFAVTANDSAFRGTLIADRSAVVLLEHEAKIRSACIDAKRRRCRSTPARYAQNMPDGTPRSTSRIGSQRRERCGHDASAVTSGAQAPSRPAGHAERVGGAKRSALNGAEHSSTLIRVMAYPGILCDRPRIRARPDQQLM
jgi:hypothetical protein